MMASSTAATAMNDKPISVPLLQQHSNENLLKIDTHDKYSTVNALKKQIVKSLSEHAEIRAIIDSNNDVK